MNPTVPLEATPKTDTGRRKVMMPIDRLVEDLAMQVRGDVFPERIKYYEGLIRENGGHLDPVDAFFPLGTEITDETTFLLADGFHRVPAYRNCGYTKVPCILRPGDRSDAIRFALKNNSRHGFQMSSKEKRHACTVAVMDPVVGEMTDADIARMVGCSATLVAQARRGETALASSGKTRARSKSPAQGEGESSAPREVTARERPATETRPTKARVLRQIQDYLESDVVAEADLIQLMDAPDEHYRWVRKPGNSVQLVVEGSEMPLEILMEVACIETGKITLKYSGVTLGRLAIAL